MTKLTYIFPCIAGCLRVILPLFPKWQREDPLEELSGGLGRVIWLAVWIAVAFFTICLIYGVFHIVLALTEGDVKTRSSGYVRSLTLLCKRIREDPLVIIALLNCVVGALELLLVIRAAAIIPNVGAAFVLVTTSVGLLVTGLALDLTGWVWVKRAFPHDVSCVGASILFLGLVLLLMHPASVSTSVPSVNTTLALGLTAGCASAFSHVLTHKLSITAQSYWGGTSLCAGGQTFILLLAGLIVERGDLSRIRSYTETIWNDLPTALLCVGVAASQVLASACVQFFGGAGGYFTAFAPFVAGEVVLSGLRDMMQGVPGYSTPKAIVDVLPCTPFCIFGLLLVFGGSILMWVGRWTAPAFSDSHDVMPEDTVARAGARVPIADVVAYGTEEGFRRRCTWSSEQRSVKELAVPHTASVPSVDTIGTVLNGQFCSGTRDTQKTECASRHRRACELEMLPTSHDAATSLESTQPVRDGQGVSLTPKNAAREFVGEGSYHARNDAGGNEVATRISQQKEPLRVSSLVASETNNLAFRDGAVAKVGTSSPSLSEYPAKESALHSNKPASSCSVQPAPLDLPSSYQIAIRRDRDSSRSGRLSSDVKSSTVGKPAAMESSENMICVDNVFP